ncbi:MAG: ATP-binding protein [Clostridia bacterium]|nr:ATP-binding protein [Clostridia bacterium]
MSSGTEQLAFSICEYITQTASIKPYCGPATDEHTFEQHMTSVIPNSKLFLVVVNDDVPTDNFGHLDKNACKYFYSEIKTFFELVKNNERSVKDFAVIYVGNLKKNDNEKTAFIEQLFEEIDPECKLEKGNQYYLLTFGRIVRWINERRKNNEENISVVEYFPFIRLENYVDNCLENENNGYYLIKAERGMGKTTFIKNLSQHFENNGKFNVKVLDFYIDEVTPYSRLPDFSNEITRRVKEDAGDNWSDIEPLEIDSDDLSESFINFINNVKRKIYYDRKLVIVFDGIDNIRSNFSKTILDYFKNSTDLLSDIFVFFTSSIPSKESSIVYDPALIDFEDSFEEHCLELDSNDVGNIEFLESFYSNKILGQYDFPLSAEIKAELFFNTPNNILSFSILYKIIKTYVKNNQKNCKPITSLSNAFEYFYDFVRTNFNQDIVDNIEKILCMLALSEKGLSNREICNVAKNDLLLKSVVNYDFFHVFISEYVYDGTIYYSIVHQKIKDLIINKNEKIVKKLVDDIFFNIKVLLESKENLESLLENNFSNFLFLNSLLTTNLITSENKQYLVDKIVNLDYDFNWTHPNKFTKNQISLINCVLSAAERNIVTISNKDKAKLYGVLGMSHHLFCYYEEANSYFLKSKELYESENVNDFSNEDSFNYAEMLSIFATQKLMEGKNKEGKIIFKICMDNYLKLFNNKFITVQKYLSNLISYSNVLNANKNYGEQLLKIKQAKSMLAKLENEWRLNGFVSYSNYSAFFCLKNYKKASKALNETIDWYEQALKFAPKTLFIGDVFKAYVEILKLSKYMKLDSQITKSAIADCEKKISQLKKKYDFYNFEAELYFISNLAELNLYVNDKENALKRANLIKKMVNIRCSTSVQQYDIYKTYIETSEKIINLVNGGAK